MEKSQSKLVKMSCENCGSPLTETRDGVWECKNCGTKTLEILVPQISGDVSIISPEEFKRQLEANKRQVTVAIDRRVKVVDVDTAIYNKCIADAENLLKEYDFDGACKVLQEVPRTIFQAQRLFLFSKCEVQDETGFLYGANIYNDSRYLLESILELADEKTAETYKFIAKLCNERVATDNECRKMIKDAVRLMNHSLYDEATAYTQKILHSFPTNPLAWAWAVRYKEHTVTYDKHYRNVDVLPELIKMFQCLSQCDDVRYACFILKFIGGSHSGRDIYGNNTFNQCNYSYTSHLAAKIYGLKSENIYLPTPNFDTVINNTSKRKQEKFYLKKLNEDYKKIRKLDYKALGIKKNPFPYPKLKKILGRHGVYLP